MADPSILTRPNNLTLAEIKPDQLHDCWPFILRGLEDICKRLKPDWIVPDVYSALRAGHATCCLISRSRPLGYLIYYKQNRPFSQKPELFVWAAWALPIRERLDGDDLPSAITAGWYHLCDVAKTVYGTDRISWITSRRRAKAFEIKYGWRSAWAVYNVQV